MSILSTVDRVREALARIPEDYAIAETLDRPATRGGSAGSDATRAPASLSLLVLTDTRTLYRGDDAEDCAQVDRMAGERRQGVLPQLWLWCRMVESEAMEHCPQLPDELPQHPSVTGCCGWLSRHLDWSSSQPWFDVEAEDILSLARLLRDVLGDPRPYRPRHVTPEGCWGLLRAVREGDGHVAYYECGRCGMVINPWARVADLTARPADTLLRLADIARAVGRDVEVVKKWAQRGLIAPVARRGGVSFYDLADADRVAERLSA